MRYRLKDKELQRKLDELSDGDFSARLHKERELIKDSFKKEPRLHVLWFGEGSQFSAALYADMLEEVQEYDPHAWNKYPEVEPPKDVWMRCENVYGSEPERLERFAARYTSQYEDGEWVDAWFSNGLRRDVTSFRPWDEEDDEE